MKKDNLEAIYPLSPMQEGMLFHSLYAPQLEVYFEQFAYTLQGNLNTLAFKQAWQQVTANHPVLRTLFLWEDQEKPLQVVVRRIELPWSEHDWRAIPDSEQLQQLQDWLQADRTRGFDLSQAPVMRLNLIRLGEYTYHFTWSFHHILLDGWSVFKVIDQVFSSYEALLQGKRFALPISRPYRDYIAWLLQQDLSQAEAFWRKTLTGFTTPISLGISRPHLREAEPVGEYRHHQISLSEATTDGLQQLARQHRLTLNTLVQGAWALLLARYSGQEDVVFGATVSGRPVALAGAETMVGLFINTLPVRVQLAPQQSLIPWLQQLQAQQVEARQYEYSPLAQVQSWSEAPRGQPLFETLLVFENYPIDALTAQMQERHLTIASVEAVEQTNYPLTVTVVPGTSMLIRLGYKESRFAASAMERLAGHLQTVLDHMVAQPDQCLSQVSLFTQAELQQLIHDWNSTQTNYPHEQSIVQVFEAQVRRTPEAVALVFEEQQLTYQELDERANQLAHYLAQLEVGCETLVGVGLPRCLEMVVALLGILKAGGAYVPLDLSYPPERLAFMQHDAALALVLTHVSLLGRFAASNTRPVCLDRDWPAIANQSREALHAPVSAEHLAYVIYTSGSTGVPKGVQVQQGSVLRLVCGVDYVPLDASIRVLHLASTSFDAATFELWAPLLHGGRCVLFAGELPSVQVIGEALQREQINLLWLTASLFNVVIDEAPQVLAGLAYLLIGGEALSVPHVRRGLEGLPGVQIINGYGPTENTTFSCCEPIEPSLPIDVHSIPIGRPIANTQAYVLDAWGQVVPIGVVGELYLGGAGLARGYLQRPELTAERFVPHPFSGEPGERLYRTGDLVRYLADGRLEFVGRRDGQVKLRGFRIELGEIEAALLGHEAVCEAAVVLQEEAGEKRLVGYLVASPDGQELSVAAVRSYLAERLPDYMVPAVLLPLEALPLTPNGKLDRHALPVLQSSRGRQDGGYTSPRTDTEERLAAIWASVLKLERVGVHDNFFELGGHSLLATRIISRVRASFQITLPLRSLFQAPTIAELGQIIEEYQIEQGIVQMAVIQRAERDDGEQILEHLEQLSDEAIEALFDMMITKEEIDG